MSMRVPASIDVDRRGRRAGGAPDAEATARRALAEAAAAIGADCRKHEVALLLTDDAAVRRLNAQWRGIDKPTNVLSFPPPPGGAGDAESLGDIAIAYETTAREARAEEKPFAASSRASRGAWISPPAGLRSRTEAQAETMESLERAILARLGVPDPYRRTRRRRRNATNKRRSHMPDTNGHATQRAERASALPNA